MKKKTLQNSFKTYLLSNFSSLGWKQKNNLDTTLGEL